MDIILFTPDQLPQRIEQAGKYDADQMIWFDFDQQTLRWFRHFKDFMNFEIDEQHILEHIKQLHPELFIGTPRYEMLIFRGLGKNAVMERLETQPTVFFLFESCLVTIHSEKHHVIEALKQRFLNDPIQNKSLLRPEALMHKILEKIVDHFLTLQEAFSEQLDNLREKLLHNHFRDWHLFITYKRQLRKLETLCEQQLDALVKWREEVQGRLDEPLAIRYNDLVEHIYRVLNHVKYLQGEIEFLIQLQFSAQAQRVNEIFILLTLLSVIFLPLNLTVGVFGMNFEYLPLIKNPWGPVYLFSVMGFLVGGLLVFFKWKRWL